MFINFSPFSQDANKVKARYLEGQVITGKMRAILIDWLVQVHLRFTLLQETLYLTVAIIDRFLQVTSLTRGIMFYEMHVMTYNGRASCIQPRP